MIVKRENEKHILCNVGDLQDGRVFEKHGIIYLKVFNPKLTKDVSAINVEDGTLYQFASDVKVIPLYAELVIGGECRL